jgi:hypothetical protein
VEAALAGAKYEGDYGRIMALPTPAPAPAGGASVPPVVAPPETPPQPAGDGQNQPKN